MESIDKIYVKKDTETANLVQASLHIWDGVMTCDDVLVNSNIITAEPNERFGSFGCNDEA